MHNFEQAFFKAISFAVVSIVSIFLMLATGLASADALSNPLAGKPLGFDDMLPYMSEDQPATADNGNNPLQDEGIAGTKEEMNMEDVFGSEQVFPFEPGLGNGGRT